MNRRIVYILGAGFSAPMGIPVMSDFAQRARDLRREGAQYAHLDEVIQMIRSTNSARTYFKHEPENMEEALSFLELRGDLQGSYQSDKIRKYIVDVIRATTPPVPKRPDYKTGWQTFFTEDTRWQGYCAFVASILKLSLRSDAGDRKQLRYVDRFSDQFDCSIITFNYDLLLENVCQYLQGSFETLQSGRLEFSDSLSHNPTSAPLLLKLHGSIDKEQIFPPTYIKPIQNGALPRSWKEAYDVLALATDVRVIGYSFPRSDSYFKYLLMTALDSRGYLKQLDWITLDPEDDVRRRVKNVVEFKGTRFVNARTEEYLGTIYAYAMNRAFKGDAGALVFNDINSAHESFMMQPRGRLGEQEGR